MKLNITIQHSSGPFDIGFDFDTGTIIIGTQRLETDAIPVPAMHRIFYEFSVNLASTCQEPDLLVRWLYGQVCKRHPQFESTLVSHLAFTEDGIIEVATAEITGPMEADCKLDVRRTDQWSVGGSCWTVEAANLKEACKLAVDQVSYSLETLVRESTCE